MIKTRKSKPWYERAIEKSDWIDSCLVFNGGKVRQGYVQIWDGNKQQMLHRLSYKKSKGEIPEGLIVRHTCDNPSCWNPEHLILGSNQDNSNDMIKRNRSAKGSLHGMSKLTEDQVREIKILIHNLLGKDIAKKFSVSPSIISRIKNNKKWNHIGDVIN